VSSNTGKASKTSKTGKAKKPDPHSPFAALRATKEKLAKEEAGRAPKAPAVDRPRVEKADPEQDRLSFQRLMSGVMPLEQAKGRMPKSPQVPPSGELVTKGREADARAAVESEADRVRAHLRSLVEGRERFQVEDDGRRVVGWRVDLPMDAVRKLRRGVWTIDARLDLHGTGVEAAREKVTAFLRDKRLAGERCVLVIHGKGEHSPRAQPVLRGEIGAWLSQGAASEHVAAFATAAADDGGEGAVYVLLRREGA
jgi:DNA-nicking Smr family endonuclease